VRHPGINAVRLALSTGVFPVNRLQLHGPARRRAVTAMGGWSPKSPSPWTWHGLMALRARCSGLILGLYSVSVITFT
jgi:hypothetical protein